MPHLIRYSIVVKKERVLTRYELIVIIFILWTYKLLYVSRFSGSGGFDNSVYQQRPKHHGNTHRDRQNQWVSDKRPRFGSSRSQKHQPPTSNRGVLPLRRHKTHHRPTFAGPIQNVTVNVGREATLECLVNHLDKYKVIDNSRVNEIIKM